MENLQSCSSNFGNFQILVKIKIKKLKNIPLPKYQHKGDSGMDLINSGKDILIKPQEKILVPTGIKVQVPEGYELQVRSRSGAALNKGLTVLNSPGTIDSNYRGEIKVILFNVNPKKEVEVKKWERIAQIVFKKVERIEWEECDDLNETERNEGGFGSTG